MLGECGRVEDYKVVLATDMFEVLHCIGRYSLVWLLLAKVKTHILICQMYGTLRCIHRAYLHSTSRCGIYRESSSVAECVEQCVADGFVPEHFASANIDGGDEINNKLLEKYKKEIKHL